MGNKTKNTERGIINPNGIIIDGDIAVTTGMEPGKDRLLLLRTMLCILSSFFTMSVLCSFIKAETVTFLPIVMISLSFAALCSGNTMLKVFGIGYFIFQISYLALMFSDIINGFYIALDKYLRLADIDAENITEIVKRLDPKQHDYMLFHFLMFLAAMVTALIALACIVRFDFPIFFIATFPFMEIGLYHGWNPPTVPAVGMVISWIIVLAVTMINHSTNKAGINNTFAVHRRKRAYYFTSQKLKSRFYTNYISIIALLCTAVFAVSIIFSAVTGFVRPKSFNRLRSEITEMIENFSLDTIADLFKDLNNDDIKEVGPTNGGKLGEKEGIKFENSTALDVIMLNQPSYTTYLRGYIAGDYDNNSWEPVEESLSGSVINDFNTFGNREPVQNFNHLMYSQSGLSVSNNTISVGIGEADDRFVYAPYMADYTSRNCITDEIIEPDGEGSVNLNERKYQLDFIDLGIYGSSWDSSNGIINSISYLQNTGNPLNSSYSSFVDRVYRDVTQSEGLDKAYNEILKNLNEYSQFYGYDLLACYHSIKAYFDSNYKYDLSPGKTPKGEDFINYFLSVQKKGYCSYFASAGVMLMRKMGYPARYVEGYVIAPTEFVSTTDSRGNKVIRVNVTDKSAHAWCEVFIDNIGWLPLEFTPGYQNGGNPNKTEKELNPNTTTTTTVTTTTKSSASTSKMTSGSNKSGTTTTTKKEVNGSNGSSGDKTQMPPRQSTIPPEVLRSVLIYTLIFVLIMTSFIVNRVHRLKKQRTLIEQEDYRKAVVYIYIYYLKYLSLIDISDDSNVSDEAQALNLIKKCRENDLESIVPDIMMLSQLAIEAHLSPNCSISKDVYFQVVSALADLRSHVVPPRLSFIGRLASKWLYGLY